MTIQETKNKIHALVAKYEAGKEFYRTSRFNESELRNEFLDPLFEALGWDIRNSSGRSTHEREVLLEEALKSDSYTHCKKPDYTFRLYGERKFFIEAKKPCVHIEHDHEPARQLRRYGYTAGLRISVLSNFEHLYIYDTSYAVEEEDNRTKALIREYQYTEYETAAEELLDLLGRDAVYSGRFDEVWKGIEGNANPKSVDQLFLEQINQWRLLLGKEIYQAMPDIDMDYLGDVVQSYINKILFLRVCEDRNIETYRMLLHIADHNSHSELVGKFREADRKYNSGLFEQLLSDSVIGNLSSSFWTIIRQLYYPESPYSFAVLSSDILGKIYEIFLAQRLEIKEGELVIVNKPEHVERDIVTTPHWIVCEILRQTATPLISSKDDRGLLSLSCADIACGSGAFLLQLYQLLCDSLTDWYLAHDPSALIRCGANSYRLPFASKRNLLTRCIFGVDKDYNAVEACKFGLLLKLLEDEDVNTLSGYHPVLPDLNNNIFYGNSLLSPADVPANLAEKINPFDFDSRKFDLIVGNPPYMKTEEMKRFTPEEKRLYEQGHRYRSANKQYDKYFLFIERALSLLNESGCMGYIVPGKFMKVGAASELRKLIAEGRHLKSITSFGAHQVFEDKSTYTCIIVLQKRGSEEFFYNEVDNLRGWFVRDEKEENLCRKKASDLSEETWILCTNRHKVLLDKLMLHSKPLGEIVGSDYIFNGIQTSANRVYVFTPTGEEEETYTFKAFNGQSYQIEKAITKPYFRTAQGADALNTYRTFAPNARVIFPYIRGGNGNLEILSLDAIQQRFPLLYAFLQDAKNELDKPTRDIQPAPANDNEWHRYGRHQSLEACEIEEKIIVGVLAQSDKYAIDRMGTLVSSGGTAGYCLIALPPDSNYSIYYIQAMLNAVQSEWMASLYGEIFRGGYIARGTKVLKQIPIRTINFEDREEREAHDAIAARQKSLIELGDKMAGQAGNRRRLIPLQRLFYSMKREQQEAINSLYGMTEQEVLQIPIIKENYATD